MKELLLVHLLSPLLSAPLMLALGRRLGRRTGWAALVAPLLSFAAGVALYLGPPGWREPILWDWIPSLGIQLSFDPDGLALFYGLLVSGVGVLVTFFSTYYLDDRYQDHGEFYLFLQLFMAAMLATVFSSNLLLLFTAWELTGIASFFLIGFLFEKQISRRGARIALLTTALTGLAMLAGFVLIQEIFGTLELGQILGRPIPAGKEGLATAAFALCFVGIAGKSALFPFHYWLPNAMAAPTPVSAYLHSATMVKLGVFLTARLLPIFSGLDAWMPLLIGVGFFTFFLGSLLAWLSYDLKSVLAYTTVAQLGMLVGQYGFATAQGAAFGDFLHILNHSLYKACLFMVVGVIDHSAGTRDLRELGGLWRKMPLTSLIGLVALASMAGFPLTSGFISKELLIETSLAFQAGQAGLLGAWPLWASVGASLITVLLSLRIARHVFFGEIPAPVLERFHKPSRWVLLPPGILASKILSLGLLPSLFGAVTASFVPPGIEVPHLSLWHGLTPTLSISLGIFATAGLLFWLSERYRWPLLSVPRPLRFDDGADAIIEGIPQLGLRMDRALGFHRASLYLPIVAASFVLALVAYLFFGWEHVVAALGRAQLWPNDIEAVSRWGVVLAISVAAFFAAAWKRPIPQLFAVSAVGLGVAFFYILYRAPDLALTQFLIEAATLFLVLLVVVRFKRDQADRQPQEKMPNLRYSIRVAVAIASGLFLGLGVLVFQNPEAERAGSFYLENTVALAKGANAVNTVVVDFRGFDTMLEITVLLIAALGCLGLLFRPSLGRRSDEPLPSTNLFPAPRDFILWVVAIGAFIPLNLLSAFIFLRGHDAAGGGFVSGLITSLSLLLLIFVIGVEGFRQRLPAYPLRIAVSGILLAVLTAIAPMLFGYPLLYHFYVQVGPLTLGTATLFEAGVFLAVVGVTLKLMVPLMLSVHGLPIVVREDEGRFTAPDNEPIDLNPTLHAQNPPGGQP